MTPAKPKQPTEEATAILPPMDTASLPEGQELLDPAQRHAMIAEAAFFIAQARGFTSSQEVDDWLAAEREIDQRLSKPAH